VLRDRSDPAGRTIRVMQPALSAHLELR
jgi:hypothetical protein